MNVLSLFDGISCGRVALGRAGIKVDNYFASEIDKYAIKISNKNYPDIIQLGDINNWKKWNLPKIDFIIGGSPCQGFSMAGVKLNFDDPRSKLFFTFVDIVKQYKPKYFLLENVQMKKEWQDIISGIFGLKPIAINSSLVSAQSRRRLYWTNIEGITQPEDKHIYLKDIVESGVVDGKVLMHRRGHGYLPTVEYYADKCPALFTSMIDYTILDNGAFRKITPLETERLQTLEDNYTESISPNQRYKCVGNGWTIDVIAHIFSFIKV